MTQQKITELENLIKKEHPTIAGIVVQKNETIVYENYFNDCTEKSPIHVFSVTKSIISLLIGIALDKGYLDSVQQKVLTFFPDNKMKQDESVLKSITIEELLTMRAPYKFQEEPYIEYFKSHNYAEFALEQLGGQASKGDFRYTPLVGPDILSAILVKTTGRSVFDFAIECLFKPLNINVEKSLVFTSKEEQIAFYEAKNISGWVADSSGINTAGWGLTLTCQDMRKIGQLYLNKGMWQGKQLVSSHWINKSTQKHSEWKEMHLSYGYLWWVLSEHEFAAMGDGGNTLYVNTKEKLIVSITALFAPNINNRIDFIHSHIEPLFASNV